MGLEWELKFSAPSPAVLEEIRQWADADFTEIPMETTYLDTPGGALAMAFCTLRIRQEGEKRVVTLKTPAAEGGRLEWEYEGSQVELSRLAGMGVPEELLILLEGPLHPVCGARFIRQAALVDTGACQLELALDRGMLFREERQCALCEVETEWKGGDKAAVAAYAAEMARKFALKTESRSKFARAKSL